MTGNLTRRQLLRTGAAAGLAAGIAGLSADPLLSPVLAAPARRGTLKDIEHVVVLIQENRSFDHYFGTFPGVNGFANASQSVLAQPGYPAAGFDGALHPFHLPTGGQPNCFPDITHDWAPQHQSWNGGAMNGFVKAHLATDPAGAGPATMGYYEQADIPYYWALAKAYTICDHYHCSLIGPTYPNRLMTISATIDPAGTHGGPMLHTLGATDPDPAIYTGRFTWTTMYEQLQARGVSWKVYSGTSLGSADNVCMFFKNFQTNPTLNELAFKPTFPADFVADINSGQLPHVSWMLTSLAETEHPGFSTAKVGEYVTRQVLEALWAKPKVWEKTAVFITWDENGGFFDHVNPPTPPPGTPGEYVTASTGPAGPGSNGLPADAVGIAGPIGLGFRVPMLVVSPFSRGGFVSSGVFDHTSILRFLETRFGAEVPNLSAWRRAHTGDLTSAFNFAHPAQVKVPRLPAVNLTSQQITTGGCSMSSPVTVPPNSKPHQPRAKPRRPSGLRKR